VFPRLPNLDCVPTPETIGFPGSFLLREDGTPYLREDGSFLMREI